MDSVGTLDARRPSAAARRARAADKSWPTSPPSRAQTSRRSFSHYNVLPVIDVFGGVDGRDLGGVLHDIQPLVEQAKKDLPRGSFIVLRGQAETMHSSFVGLGVGLVGAIVLIYLLLVVNFQSWLDPFIIITALPGALAGVVWALFLSQTTLSVPALMGAIMSLGVATANSVLVVSFARDNLRRGMEPLAAALDAGVEPHPAGADDGAGDDDRHVADEPRPRRRRRAKRAARPRGHRRTCLSRRWRRCFSCRWFSVSCTIKLPSAKRRTMPPPVRCQIPMPRPN